MSTNQSARRRPLARLMAGVVAGALAWGLGAAPSSADDSETDLTNQQQANLDRIAELEALTEDADADLIAVAIALAETQGKLPAAELKVAETTTAFDQATADLEVAQSAYDDIVGRLDQAETQHEAISGEIDASAASVEDSRRVLGAMARETVRGQVQTPELLVFLSGGVELAEMADSYVVTSTVAAVREGEFTRASQELSLARTREVRLAAVAEEISGLEVEAADALAKADQARTTAEAAKAEAEVAKGELDDLAAEQESQQAELEDRKADYEAEQSDLETENADISARLTEIAEEKKRQAALEEAANGASGGGGGSGQGPALTPGFFGAPLSSLRMTSPYGSRFHPIWQQWRFHAGTDFGVGCGEPIYASAPGTVIFAGWSGGYGNRVEISHGVMSGNSMVSTYSHQSSLAVGSGQSVDAGQVIGYVGTTGSSTGCHLHFEIYADGSTVDPMSYLS